MKKNEAKKMILYELKLESFKDGNISGRGDSLGLWSRNYYFDFLKVNTIVIDDILSQYENATNLEEVKQRHGSLSEFITMTKNYFKKGIFISPTIDFKKLKQTYLNWNNMMYLYDIEKKETSPFASDLDRYSNNNYLNPNNSIVELANIVIYFEKIINFYFQCGIKVFTLENFDFLIAKQNFKNKKSNFRFLQDLYKMIKRLSAKNIVILKSHHFTKVTYLKMAKLKEPCFDYLYLNHLSLLDIDPTLPFIRKRPLNLKHFLKQYRPFSNDARFIMSLGSNLVGRINSRWGDEKAYFSESAKSFLLVMFAAKNSAAIYYGDELGMLQANIKKPSDFFDKNYNEDKRFYESINVSKETYFEIRKSLDKISANNLMSWNDRRNSGFSDHHSPHNLVAKNFEKNNVTNQAQDPTSPLNFVDFLISLWKKSEFNSILEKGTAKVSLSCAKILKIKRTYKHNKILFILNMTNKARKMNLLKDWRILGSTYFNKFYASIPNKLDPFESLILVKTTKSASEFSKEDLTETVVVDV
ncbi:Oligo-1,6-glucosidase [Metamycoplasma arthritidis]|uniref:Oligo-1,6-glucosidase, probable membrane protein n=1 Tax=Metamycoplasma arthritidis (strain 158L3-1) TaxID=243272 RepID=B3PMF4_META1|nr:alpha-amylase family glycosyl hydrolase [Metamycoplasma arthritidis]ACF07206.1 oligo-1,6-glucosidase, probable membrane protein [Metamycoplasma arthritidis 158L3-1]VEU78730.1 Oligo-1,6-glucosidase [Metamycoplasma arthritidis]